MYNFSVEPRIENLIFSSSKKDIVQRSHEVGDGGNDFFHRKSIIRRAINEVNYIMFACLTHIFLPDSGIAKMAICGHDSIIRPSATDIILK